MSDSYDNGWTKLVAEREPDFGPGKVLRPHRDVRISKDKSPYESLAPATLTGKILRTYIAGMPEVVVIATATARPGQEATHEEALRDAAVPTRAQPGCISFELLRRSADPATMVPSSGGRPTRTTNVTFSASTSRSW